MCDDALVNIFTNVINCPGSFWVIMFIFMSLVLANGEKQCYGYTWIRKIAFILFVCVFFSIVYRGQIKNKRKKVTLCTNKV